MLITVPGMRSQATPPYELMFGRSPRLPVDLAFDLPVGDVPTLKNMQNLRSWLEQSYQVASKNAARSSQQKETRL